jgi:cell division protein FtsW
MKHLFSEQFMLKGFVAVLALIGCLTVFNATLSSGASANFALRQFTWLIIGILVMELLSRCDFDIIKRFSSILFFFPLILLWLVLLFGVQINGMKGWFQFGIFLFQPSEFMKPFFVLAICVFFKERSSGIRALVKLFLLLLGFVLPLIMEPDYGTSLIYIATLAIFIFLTVKNMQHFFLFVFICGAILALFTLKEAYVLRRIEGYLFPFRDPYGAGWHIIQFKYTIARGGLWGCGWGNCLWANSYLPLSHSDSAFATLAEASGIYGIVPVLVLFAAMPFIALRLASRQAEDFNALFIILAFFMITCQAFVHIFVNLGVFPPTGLTLPLFSYGGSSLISTMSTAGLVISASKNKARKSS